MSNIRAAALEHLLTRETLLAKYPELAEDEEALSDTLEGVSDLADLAFNVVRAIEIDEAMVAGAKGRIEELKHRITRFEASIEAKRRLLADAMSLAGEKTLRHPEFTLSLATAKRTLIVTDEGAIPDTYLVYPEIPAPRPDKRAIQKALDAGDDIPGCALSNGGDMQIVLRRK